MFISDFDKTDNRAICWGWRIYYFEKNRFCGMEFKFEISRGVLINFISQLKMVKVATRRETRAKAVVKPVSFTNLEQCI
jgi:hypothetical protein